MATDFTTGSVSIVAGNNITFSTGANVFTISGPNTHAQQTAISAIANSETTYTSGTISLVDLANITIRSTTGQKFEFSVAAAGGAQTAISGLANSETTYTSGTVTLEGTNNITVFSTTGQRFRISGANTHAQQTGISAISNSNTTYTSGTVGLSELANITIRSTTGNQFQFSVAASHAQQTGISALSNSNTTYTSGTVGLSELGAITIRSTTGNQFQFSVNSQTTQTQGVLSAGLSTGGNTQGNTTVNTGSRLVFVGTNNITLSQATAAGATTISISGQAPAGGAFSGGISNLGNTAGSTGITGSQNVFVGSDNITLSGSTGANGATVSIIGPSPGGGGGTLSGYAPYEDLEKVGGQVGQGTLQFDPQRVGQPFQFDRLQVPIINTNSSNSSGSHTVSMWFGFYTRNASTLSLQASTSTTLALTHSGTAGSYSLYSGQRLFTIPMTSTFTTGQYWFGVVSRTTSGGANGSYSQLIHSNIASNFLGHFSSAHNTTMQFRLGQGVYSATTSGIPGSVAFSQIRGSDSLARRAPAFAFGSGTV